MHACYLSMRFRCVFTIGILLVCDLLNAIYELYVIREWSIKPTTQILLTSQCEWIASLFVSSSSPLVRSLIKPTPWAQLLHPSNESFDTNPVGLGSHWDTCVRQHWSHLSHLFDSALAWLYPEDALLDKSGNIVLLRIKEWRVYWSVYSPGNFRRA